MNNQDTNECRLSGAVERIKPVRTRTGQAMAEIILKVRQDKFRVTAHGNVADHLLSSCGHGDRLSITGTLSTSSWRDEVTGEWRNSFAVTAWAAEIHGDKIAFERKKQVVPPPGGVKGNQGVKRERHPTEKNHGRLPYVAQPGDPF